MAMTLFFCLLPCLALLRWCASGARIQHLNEQEQYLIYQKAFSLPTVLDKIRDVFGIEPGETTDDDKFTVFEVECLGACEQAPCALVNEDLHGCIKPDEFAAHLRTLPDHPAGAGH